MATSGDLVPALIIAGSVHPRAWSHGARAAIPQTGHFVLDLQFFTLEAAEQQLVRQGTVGGAVGPRFDDALLNLGSAQNVDVAPTVMARG